MNKLHKKKGKKQEEKRSESRTDGTESLRELKDMDDKKCFGDQETNTLLSRMSEREDNVERPMSSVRSLHQSA